MNDVLEGLTEEQQIEMDGLYEKLLESMFDRNIVKAVTARVVGSKVHLRVRCTDDHRVVMFRARYRRIARLYPLLVVYSGRCVS